MRAKLIRVSAELIIQFLTEGNEIRGCVIEKGIPKGATLGNVEFRNPGEAWIEVHHPDFPVVGPGWRAPFLEIIIRQRDDNPPPKAMSA